MTASDSTKNSSSCGKHRTVYVIILTSIKSPKELKVTDLPDPQPGPNDYLIEVHAAAANFFDILQIQGKYQNQPRMSQSTTVQPNSAPSGFCLLACTGG